MAASPFLAGFELHKQRVQDIEVNYAITGGTATHRIVRDYGPLDYDTDGLLAVIYAERETLGRAAAD